MQIVIEMTTLANIATALFSAVLSIYLFSLWRRQENPLLTDLPLMFGITFLTQAVNNLILVLPALEILEASLDLFRFRSIVIIGTAFPMLVVLVTIWLPRFKKHHSKIIGLLAVYWVLVALLAPSDQIIMMLHLPVIATLTIGMIITFSITWRTGRLKEVRSELIVLSFLFGLVGQAAKVPLMNMGLDVLGHIINAAVTVLATLALANPWYRRGESVDEPVEERPVAAVAG
ncbi:hypothetical protein EU545_02645 [Candidatus Thorarchaeota archaeon]|jgi:hypothetical protein|nr:MAG: hypothetical protein EU545_02645 [Candidatus Thorarchaeota archaeon]